MIIWANEEVFICGEGASVFVNAKPASKRQLAPQSREKCGHPSELGG